MRPAPAGQVPTTLEAVDAEAGLPALAVPPAAEKHGAAILRTPGRGRHIRPPGMGRPLVTALAGFIPSFLPQTTP